MDMEDMASTTVSTGTPDLDSTVRTLHTIHTPIPAFHYRGKREADAEADPQLLLDGRIQTFHLPQDVQTVFNTAIPEKVVYPQTPLLKTADHTVVATPAGYVHSSHVGLCTNNMGVAVPC